MLLEAGGAGGVCCVAGALLDASVAGLCAGLLQRPPPAFS